MNHNHVITTSYREMAHWPSHKHIDVYKDLGRQLRKNINLCKLYIVIGGYFGRVENVTFTKRPVRNLCGQISRDEEDNTDF